MKAIVAEMRLQSTVRGPEPLATINGSVVRVGDVILGFSVERIGVRFVVLDHAGRRFVLTMD